jgi:proline iminopeptidase
MNEYFYPAINPLHTGSLAVDALHTLYWEECGNAEGLPIVFLHGGPGAGCTAADRRFFDPKNFRIILMDQRGSGRSTPAGELRDNSPDHLVADLEKLRQKMGIDRWHVFGGSWGSSLAIHYTECHPEQVLSLVLRGIWLLRDAEIDWWLYRMGWMQPELWRAFAHHLPAAERGDLLEGYWRRLEGDDRKTALAAAQAWSIYEGSCCTLLPNEEFTEAFADPEMAWNLARLEAHYFRNVRFQPHTQLLDRVARLKHIPSFAVHGRYDLVCPVRNLDDLQRAWPELDAVIVPDAGHSSHEAGITRELVAATDRIAATGNPLRHLC